eukprot:TRINITY_DN46585_c0_g1_i1.p1 TRINITY_DN46585_c0_g1~~TRINITY_DN46585_c0_g1_i1.p1  ORF type:complete len:132 (+),score=22.84 TRINITY_DN46585_c0_g1_i1:95-490(+)
MQRGLVGSEMCIRDRYMGYCESVEETNKVLLQIDILFCSHFHGDHSFGILKILKEADTALKLEKATSPLGPINPIYVVLDFKLISMITIGTKLNNFNYPERIIFIDSGELNPEPTKYYASSIGITLSLIHI